MAHYSASLNSEARSKSSSKSSDDVFYESKGLEAAQIVDLLLKEIIHLTGGRDKEGGPILTFPMHREPVTFSPNDIYDCIQYLSQIPSEESQWQGFTVIIDNRTETWRDLYFLEVLKKSLHERLKRILILTTSPEDNPGYLNIDIADKIQYVTLKQLTNFISPYQLTENLGGQLPFKHTHWLQNRMDFEKFMKDSKSASNHLDHAEAQINRVYAKDNSLSPVAALKRRHKWNTTVMSVPTSVINDGRILLNQLQKNGEQSFTSEEDTIFTLDNLETQKQVKRIIHFLERKMERLLQIQENETHSMRNKEIISELQISISMVVDWILGPGEKLLSCNIDIGDTCETAEQFRKTHEELQIKCAETYGNYAELRHKAEKLVEEDPSCSDDILAQRDYMDTVCRSFASRLDRRKILLITSVRFHRFAEDLSLHLDELLELLCSETKPENSAMAATELNDLNEKCKEIDQLALQTLNDGQSLLDEMSRPMKNSIGVDITPDYASQIKHINKSVEELQERKLRCDELADVRRLKLQQVLQLFTCEKDAEQAVQWILELCEVMVKNHTEMGQSKEDAEKLQDDHKRFESTALETYHYGKELLEAALFLRRSLRYNLDSNNLIAEKLERAWKKFSQGTLERTNRLTVSVMFMTSSDEILNRIDQLFTTLFDLTERPLPLQHEVKNKHQTVKDNLSVDAQETIEMGKALLQRLALPIIVLDENSENIIKEDAKASSVIMARLHKIELSLAELNELWTEINSISSNQPKVYPRSNETQKTNPQTQRKPSYPPRKRLEQPEQIFSSQNQSLHSSRRNLSNDNYINVNVANITDKGVQEIIPSEPYMSSVMTAPYEYNNAAQKDDDLLQRLHDSGDWIQVRVHQMEPDIMDIGSNFEEAQRLHQEHIALLSQLQAKEGEIKQLLAKADTSATERGESQRDVCAAMAETLGEAWKDLNAKLEFRGKLLEQSVAFHSNANEFGIQLDQALKICLDLTFPKDVESVANMLQQHLDLKKSILESSKHTLDLGQQLLDKVRKMGMHADQQNRHATTAACYGIEHILENLHDRRRYLEEMWSQKKLQLEQCLQLCKLDQEVNKILEWYRMVGEVYLQRTDLGVSTETIQTEIETYHKYEQEGINIQENVLKLVRTADQLLRRANFDAEGVRQRLQAVDETSETFMIKLDNRRKNLLMALSFFNQAETALTKLGQIEVQLNTMDLPRNSTALSEEHTKLFNTIVEVSTAALHEGRILLERVSRDDSGANGVRQKYAELQECCARVESNCKARQAEAWEKNQAYLKFQEKYKNLHAWLTQIGLATLSRHKDLGSSLANSKDFLEIHQQLNEDVRGKATDMQALSDATDALVQSGDQEGKAAKEMYEALYQQWLKIQHIISLRIELSLIFVSFHKIIQNLAASSGIFENILKSETEDLQDITEGAVKNLLEMWSQTIKIHNDLQEKGNEFLQKTSQVTEDTNLDVAQSVTLVQKILTEYRSHITTLTEQWEIWQQRVSSSQQFKVQWHQFIQEVRKTITSITNIEKELFMPHISGQVSENKQTAEQLQKKLENYEPILKEAEEKIKEHINTAEMLSSKGDTKGQKDQIVNELVKVHQRFQARVTEYHFLLKMTIQFFGSLNQLDELINRTEQEFSTTELPSDLNQAERMLEEHKVKKSEVNQLLTHTADEGEKIVVRVRQQGADAATQDEIKRIMEISENYKRRWNQTWEEQDRRLAQNLQICQFNFDLRQIHSEIDELHHHLQARRGNYGNNLPAARMTSQAFKQFEMTVELIEKKINSFISTAELMVQDKHYDSVHIHQEIDVLKKKWSTFHTSVTDYRSLLDISVMYFQMIEETEQWVREGNQMLINIGRQATECRQPSDATTLIIKLQKFVENEKPIIEQKVNKISELSHELYGDQGANKVRHVVVSYQDLLQSFQQADNELSALKVKLEGNEASGVEEHIPMQIDIPVNEQAVVLKPPRITQHLKNAEVLEGTKFIFECHIESDEIPEIKWFKDNLPLTSPDYETRFENGVATLTIEETFSEDTARYTCRVTNQAGTAESSAHLNVKETHQQIIPPDIIKNLKSADVLEGSPFTFECQITGMPTPSISWYKDDQNIDNSPDFVITKINGTCCLKIRKVTTQESARYTCRATNAGGEASSSARLTVKPLEKPIIHEPLIDRTITEGKSITFRVVFSGVPNPEVLWFKGTEQIINSNLFKISTEHNISILDIMEAYPEDSCSYSVLVQNPAGEARSSCQLTIEQIYSSTGEEMSQSSTDVEPVKPFFSQLLQTTAEVVEGSRIRLDCIIVGNPEPEVIWYHNDKPVKESKDIQLLFEGDRCTLVIREVYLEDAGLYRCVACNPHGVAESHCQLVVEALSEMSDGSGTDLVAPTFPELLTDVVSIPGENVTLRCTVHGMPIPEIQWFKEGILIEPPSKYKPVCNGEVHSLIIPETFGEDSGTFMVKAVNPAGEAKCYGKLLVKSEKQPGMEQLTMVRRTVEKVTTVTRTEEIKQSPPEFTQLFQDVSAKQGEPVMLECIITGTPKPKVVWQYNGDIIDIRQHQPCMEGDKYRLIIPKASERDAGRFTITAENPSGRATCSARVIVEKVLAIPMETSYQSQFTRTVTQSETRLSRIIADMQEKSMSGMEHHSTTITTQVPQKFEVMGAPVATHDRFATSITTDLSPQYQQVDLRIEVPIPPKFLQALKNITALEGTKVTFDGVVTGKPEPSIKWYKKDKEITDGADFEISYKDSRISLTIPEVLEDQSGQVTCTASNYVGSASSTAELIVRASMIPPSFTERLQRRQVKEGESVKLTVRVAGTPAPQVMWYREGSRIVSSPDFEIIQEGDIHTLYIPEVFYEDSGKFTVKAKNPAGEAECMAELRVQAPPPPVVESFAHIKPVVPTHQTDVYMRPVEPPKPVQEPVHPSPIRHVQAPVPKPVPKPAQEPTLMPTQKKKPEKPSPIKSVQPPVPVPPPAVKMEVDEPEQTLPPFEKRLKLFDQPAEAPVPVVPAAVKPQMKPAPHLKPSFPRPLQNVTANEGEKVIFEVFITGTPEPVVKWFKNEKIIHNSPDFEITYVNSISKLVIAEVFAEDSGQYKCVATNVQGSNTSTAYLDVKEPISSSEESSPVSTNVPQELPVPTPVPIVQVPTASPILGVRKVPFRIPSPAPVPKQPPPPPPATEEPLLEPKKKPTVKFGAPVTQPPRFIEPLQNATLIEGINVMLECTVIGKPFPHIMWTHFGLPVIEDENHHVYTDEVTGRCTFLISQSTLRDKGDYTCTAQNIAGQDTTSAFLVEAPSVPKKIDGIHQAPKKPVPRPEHVPAKKVDDKLAKPVPQDFKCSAFEERLKQEIQFREGKIHFTGDVGSTSEYDSEHPDDKISVGKEHPRITQTLKNFRLIEGSDVTFVCKVTGKPRPKIAWYKNGVRMKRSGRCDMKYTHDGYCTLKIRLAVPEDAGHYTVLAVNSTGRDTCSAELYVDRVGPIDDTSFVEPQTLERMLRRDQDKTNQSAGGGGVFEKASKPAFQVIPENQEAREGQTVRFDCLVTGRPYPEISWYKNEVEMRSDDYHKVVVNENGIHSLIILSATRRDHGQYKCVARNKAGEAVFFVTLNVMERQEMHPPHFVECLQNYNAKENQTVTLTCTAVGCPLPMMSWQKDAKMLSSKDYDISTENGRSTLTIKNATPADSAWFQCSAVNVAGSALTRARLHVIGKGPQQPIPTTEAPIFGVRRSTSPDEIPAPADRMVVCAPAFAPTETAVNGQPTEDDPTFKPPSVAEAKLIFDQSGKPLPPPATLPRMQPKPEFIPRPVPKPAPVQEKFISPDKKVKPVKAPIPVPAESTLPRGDSPPRFISCLLHMHVDVVTKQYKNILSTFKF